METHRSSTRPDVLVVDDEHDIRQVLRVMLELEGLTVADDGDSAHALTALPVLSPRSIILDLMMPDLDGFTFLDAVRVDPVLAQIPILVLTCRTRERDYVNGLRLGAVDYVTKPFRPEDVTARIKKILAMTPEARRRQREEALERALVLQQIEETFR